MESRTTHAPRFQPLFNQVYQATGYTYISVWYDWGHGGTGALLVGDENPPSFCVGALTRDNGSDYGPPLIAAVRSVRRRGLRRCRRAGTPAW